MKVDGAVGLYSVEKPGPDDLAMPAGWEGEVRERFLRVVSEFLKTVPLVIAAFQSSC